MHMMIDIETMGLSNNAAIAQIGLAVFDPKDGAICHAQLMSVDLNSCTNVGMQIEADTVYWWLAQGDEARHSMIGDTPLDQAFENIQGVYRTYGPRRLWAHGPQFDITILQNAFEKCDRVVPWHYRSVRDSRTITAISGVSKSVLRPDEVEHNALDDCRRQIRDLIHAARRLNISLDEERN